MRVSTSLEDGKGLGPVLAVGTFDGVHRGHRRVLDELVRWARELGAPPAVLTFREHPRGVLDGGEAPPLLVSTEHRTVLLARLGIERIFVVPFTRELAAMTAGEFLARTVVGTLGARGLLVGFDTRMGSDLAGAGDRLSEIAAELGLPLRSTEPVRERGGAISSTLVREALALGDIDLAARLLGRAPSALGTVIGGRGVGKDLGWPTANLDVGEVVLPPVGIYAAWALVDPERAGERDAPTEIFRPAAVSLGFRPTIESDEPGASEKPVLEAHLLDFEGSLLGRKIELAFVERLREERRFPSLEELAAGIAKDVEKTRAVLAESDPRAALGFPTPTPGRGRGRA